MERVSHIHVRTYVRKSSLSGAQITCSVSERHLPDLLNVTIADEVLLSDAQLSATHGRSGMSPKMR